MTHDNPEPTVHEEPDDDLRQERCPHETRPAGRHAFGWRAAAYLPWLFLGMAPHVVILFALTNVDMVSIAPPRDRSLLGRIEPALDDPVPTEQEEEIVEEEVPEEEPLEAVEVEEDYQAAEADNDDAFAAGWSYRGRQSNHAIGLGGGAGGSFGGRRGGAELARQRYGGGAVVLSPPRSEFCVPGTTSHDRGVARPGSATPLPPTGRWQRSDHRPSFARVHLGAGRSLQLKRMRVTVQVDGPRARTVVDHIFYNPHARRLEGTFEYPLPSRASPCYFAMFLGADQRTTPRFFAEGKVDAVPQGVLAVMTPEEMARHVERRTWGELREARVVRREQGRRVYEEITRRRIDPALLEYEEGNTFRGRVYPIAPRSFHRVILAYEEHLEVAGDTALYRFPLPDCDLEELRVTASLSEADVRADHGPADGSFRRTVRDGRITYERSWSATRGPGGEFVLACVPEDPRSQTVAGPDPTDRGRVFYARLRPDLPAAADTRPWSDRAVFLLDTSLSEFPDRFNANLNILRRILEKDRELRLFNVMCFDVGAWWVETGGWMVNNPAGRERALERLKHVLLEGATDLGAAFDLLARTRWDRKRTPVNVFLLSDGQINWGETDPEHLLARLTATASMDPRFFCYRTGLGAENLALFRTLTRRGGGVFNVFDDSLVEAAALAHRRPCLTVDEVLVEGVRVRDLVVAGRHHAVYPGGELVVAGRLPEAGASRGVVTVRGRIQGEAKTLAFPLRLDGQSPLAARAWAEIVVNQLLDTRDPTVESLAVAYAQRFRIGSRVTSFLVLERDGDYRRFRIDEELESLHVADMGAFLDGLHAREERLPSKKETLLAFLNRRFEASGVGKSAWESDVLSLHALLPDKAFEIEAARAFGPLPRTSDVGAGYLASRQADRRQADVYLREANRRLADQGPFSAVRALSTVAEVHPGRSDALRLVGYRLLQQGQPAFAVSVFDRVREQRPFEPHSYRDLARSLESLGHFGLAALYHEVLLAGRWHDRFGPMKEVVAEQYVRMMRAALREDRVQGALRARFARRLQDLADEHGSASAPLVVTATWNTDNTDVDLWVKEPSGEACGYSNLATQRGGELMADLRVGYGPERYVNRRGDPGTYVILINYYRANPNLIAGETHVDVVVTCHAGTPREKVRRFPVVLRREGTTTEVCRIELEAPLPASRLGRGAVSR